MIYFTGDLHGGVTSYHVKKNVFRPENKGDIVFCAGDFGGVWERNYFSHDKDRRRENYFLETTLNKDLTWLAVDGNHENFARLFGGEFPLVKIYGGLAYQIRKNIYYLKRGEIYSIDGFTFFAFGGAMSHDKNPVIKEYYGGKRRIGGRTEGIDWWPEEIPSEDDYNNACRNLDKVGWRVNHVITHTCPVGQKYSFSVKHDSNNIDPTEAMLQKIAEKLDFDVWHFGHYHKELRVDKFVCHYDKVRALTDFRKDYGDWSVFESVF